MNKIIIYMIFTIAWVIIAGNFMEVGENMRFRFIVDPFIWILITVFAWRLIKK